MINLKQALTELVKIAAKWESLSYEFQKDYLKRHPGSKRRVTSHPTSGLQRIEPQRSQSRDILSALRRTIGVDKNAEPLTRKYLTMREGSSNKFHYFAVFKNKNDEFVAANAYGRIGYDPKVAIISVSETEAQAFSDMNDKIRSKTKKGYEDTKLPNTVEVEDESNSSQDNEIFDKIYNELSKEDKSLIKSDKTSEMPKSTEILVSNKSFETPNKEVFLNLIKQKLRISSKSHSEFENYMTDGESNKFHYFAVIKDDSTGLYHGANVFGKIGTENPGVSEIRVSDDPDRVRDDVDSKITKKLSKGYISKNSDIGIEDSDQDNNFDKIHNELIKEDLPIKKLPEMSGPAFTKNDIYQENSDAQLVVGNIAQKVLYLTEMSGQMSDGMWENSKGWEDYRHLDWNNIGVGGNIGKKFHANRTGYNFTNPELLDIVGDRMLSSINLLKKYPNETLSAMKKGLSLPDDLESVEYLFSNSIDYYKEQVLKLNDIGLTKEKMKNALENPVYSKEDMIKDLKGLKKAIKQ